MDSMSQQSVDNSRGSKWLTLAIGSGAFAAFNGVFAKLTTTAQTHNLAYAMSFKLGLVSKEYMVEYLIRATFFGLNLLSNAIMWILFTRALTAATSTTRVSILNASANFIVTAILGILVFAEKLPLTWWLGASLLVAGSVVIGRREGAEQSASSTEGSIDESAALDTKNKEAEGVDQRKKDTENEISNSLVKEEPKVAPKNGGQIARTRRRRQE